MGPKRRRLEQAEDILEPVRRAETVEGTLAQRLTQYVERIDTDMVRLDPSMIVLGCASMRKMKNVVSKMVNLEGFPLVTAVGPEPWRCPGPQQ